MRRNRRELGEGQFGCLVGVILLLIGVFIAFTLSPAGQKIVTQVGFVSVK